MLARVHILVLSILVVIGRDNKTYQNTSCDALQSHLLPTRINNRPITSSFVRLSLSSSSSSSSIDTATTGNQQQQQSANAGSYKIPLSWDEMIRQVATSMKVAANVGVTNQIVRVLLPRDSTSGDFGKYIELNDVTNQISKSEIQLVPPDESWQGGIMQLYRAAAPTAFEIVRAFTTTRNPTNSVPPRITEDRSYDESGVDGVGVLTTDDNSITCWIQPTQENVDEFIAMAERNSKLSPNGDDIKIVMLLNPQWRQVDDALDTASQQSTNPFLKGLANFLGGKGAVLQRCRDVGYTPVYTLEGYVCRGANVRLLQTYSQSNNVGQPPEWVVFCERDDNESYIQIGTQSSSRPTYQEVEEMMTKADIGYKYARDIGLQPKL
jgi:Domain of unknown function (DUF1995)